MYLQMKYNFRYHHTNLTLCIFVVLHNLVVGYMAEDMVQICKKLTFIVLLRWSHWAMHAQCIPGFCWAMSVLRKPTFQNCKAHNIQLLCWETKNAQWFPKAILFPVGIKLNLWELMPQRAWMIPLSEILQTSLPLSRSPLNEGKYMKKVLYQRIVQELKVGLEGLLVAQLQ